MTLNLNIKENEILLLKIKFLALHHLQTGKLLKDVADIILYDEQAIRNWIRRFLAYDYEGPIEKEGRGQRPRVIRQRQFLNTYIFGACCPDKDKSCALILPECHTGMMQLHLEEISKNIEDGFHAIIIIDLASWVVGKILFGRSGLNTFCSL